MDIALVGIREPGDVWVMLRVRAQHMIQGTNVTVPQVFRRLHVIPHRAKIGAEVGDWHADTDLH